MANRKKIILFLAPLALLALLAAAALLLGLPESLSGESSPEHGREAAAGAAESHGRGEAGARGGAGIVHLSEEEREEFGIETARAGPARISIELVLPGEVGIDPDRLAHITPRAPGIARKVQARIGDEVRAGAVMAWLESARLGEAKAAFLAGQKRLELAAADLERERAVHDNTVRLLGFLKTDPSVEDLHGMKEEEIGENRSRLVAAYAELVFSEAAYIREKRLFDKKITSEEDFLAAERGFKKAEAKYAAERDSIAFEVRRSLLEAKRAMDVAELELKSAERRLHVLGLTEEDLAGFESWTGEDEKLAWYPLSSPFDGTVIAKHITLGERLDTDMTVFAVADLGSVWIALTVYQKDLDSIRKGQAVTVRGGEESSEAGGTIDYVSPIVEESTRAATARVILANPGGLWRPGMFVTGRVVIDEAEAPLAVPPSALQTIEDRTVVFVRTPGGFEAVPVETGRSDGRSIEILSGLEPGVVFAATNTFTLKAELEKGAFGEGHEH